MTSRCPRKSDARHRSYTYDQSGRLASETGPVPPYAKVILDARPIGYWRLGETSGTTAGDSSGWNRNGTYTNTPATGQSGLLTGDADKSVRLARGALPLATDNYVNLPAIPIASSSFTIQAWAAPDTSPPASQTVFASDDTLATETLALQIHSDGRVTLNFGVDQLASGTGAVSFGATSQITATYDSTTDTAKLYVNGTEVASGSQGPFTSTTATFAVGRQSTAAPDTFKGVIDEVAVFDRVLTGAERSLHRQAGTKNPTTYTIDYEHDAAGNRTRSGTQLFTFDERNRLTNGAGVTYTWTARGTLSATVERGVTTLVSFDALGRQTSHGTVDFDYDDLDRISEREGTPFEYSGTALDPASYGNGTYSRLPSGQAMGAGTTSDAKFVIENRHGDAWTHLAESGTAGTTIFTAYGDVAGRAGTPTSALGYQADWTDPTSGDVWMGARWYQPDTGSFTRRDVVFGLLANPVSLNRYTYAGADPMQHFDPDGMFFREAWDRTGGKVVSAVNDHVVQPTLRAVSAGVEIVRSAATTVARAVQSTAVRTVRNVGNAATTVARAAVQPIKSCLNSDTCRTIATATATAVVAVGAVCAACAAASLLGAGIGAGVGVVTCKGDLNCIGKAGIAGAAAGVAAPLAGTGGLAGAIAFGAGGGAASTSAVQLMSGELDTQAILEGAAVGALTAGILHGGTSLAGTALRRVRPAATPRMGGGSEVLLDTSAVKAQSAARSLMKPGECAVICSTVEREAAQQGFSTAGLPVVADGTSAVLRSQVAAQLRGFGAAARGLENDAIIGATALERGIPLVTGDRALWNAVLKLGGEARWFAPGM